MKLSKISLAVAAVAAFASGSSAFAGQIGSSSVTVASEAIFSDAQFVRAPSNSYSFSGDIDARTNTQLLQLQYTLTAGSWSTGAGRPITAVNTLTAIPIDSALKVNYNNAANAGQSVFPAGTLVNAFVTADGRTLVFNVSIPAAAANLLRNPQFTINAGPLGALAANTDGNLGVAGLFSVVGAVACPAPDKNLDISFKHFTTHNGNTDVIATASPDSEHLRAGSTNSARLMNFVQNQIAVFTPATRNSVLSAQSLNTQLSGNNYTAGAVAAAVAPAAANLQEPGGATPAAPITRHYLGSVRFAQRANGTDVNYATAYGRAGAVALQAADFEAADDTGLVSNGQIELRNMVLTLTFPSALPTGTVVRVTDGGGAAIGAVANVTTTAGQTVVTFTATTAAEAAAFSAVAAAGGGGRVGGAHVWADFPGGTGNVISQIATVAASFAVNKDTLRDVAANPELREQNLTCTGTQAGVGGGIKIDVRNYASRASFGSSGPSSVIRIINNSENQAADVFGQIIYSNGTYGPWGSLTGATNLAPRAVIQLTNAQIEALLTNAPAAANPFGTGTTYTTTAGSAVVAGPQAGIGDRLRIVSNSGTTLRVQSYMILGSEILDTSPAQGVDFENQLNNRTPANAIDAQPVSQDAINGLAR